jgi:hypothetical protein
MSTLVSCSVLLLDWRQLDWRQLDWRQLDWSWIHLVCFGLDLKLIWIGSEVPAVIQVTEARLVNTLISTSLTSRSRVISALGRYNQKYGVVENEYI